jgi:BirA family transcriptional regulator, biotin operon repressor / biotin---[acetyl-CoA-carboxylase] ligase
LRSSRSDDTAGRADGGPYRDALEQARGRLGRLASVVVFYPTIRSTNDAAASLAAEPAGRDPLAVAAGSQRISFVDPEGAVIVADEQTVGRGRRGHGWFSPRGSGLYVSVVLTPARAVSDPRRAMRLLTLTAGVALVEAIEQAAGLTIDLKWPNDLYVGRRKLGGILAEAVTSASTMASVVLGYGINMLAVAYPPELVDRATSLEGELGRVVHRDRLFIETLAALGRRYDDLLAGKFDSILDAWRRHAPSAFGARVKWIDASGEQSGRTEGIDAEGALLVQTGERTHRIVGGELRWDI